MTLALLNELGITTSFENNSIRVHHKSQIETNKVQVIESDWSSASYFYSIIALSEIGTEITLSSYKKSSLQGDFALVSIYEHLGVETVFNGNSVVLKKVTNTLKPIVCNLNSSPDIAQTIAVTCFGLGVGCDLVGLHTLKIKETDRLAALQNELTKLGAEVFITDDSLTLKPSSVMHANVEIKTYQDHRMAMAFAPLALRTSIVIEEAEVVSKSYPNFWNDLNSIGFVYLRK